MDYPLSPKEKGTRFWQSPRPQLENSVSFEVTRSLNLEDSLLDLMNFDMDAGWYNSPSATDQILTSYWLSSFPSTPSDALNFSEQNGGAFPVNEVGGTFNPMGNSFNCGDKLMFDQMDTQYGFSMDSNNANGLATAQNNCSFPQNSVFDMGNCMIPRPLSMSVDEKMLKALSLFKASSGGGILAQVWVPIRLGDQHILSNCEQPYLLDEMLAGYREILRSFVFLLKGDQVHSLGFLVMYLSPKFQNGLQMLVITKIEYLRADHAAQHEVHGSIAVPVFDSPEMSCCAALELVTSKEKSNFNAELETVCNIPAVNLRTTEPPQLHPQCLSKNQRPALAEIIDVLRAVCHAHRLPLALSWIPCYYTEGAGDEMTRVRVREGNINSNEKCKSLRTVSDAEYLGWKSLKLHFRRKKTKAFR